MNATSTPWGAAQSSRTIAEGIVFHSTSRHGGIELSAARLARMPPVLAAIRPWAAERWYEEDCDWAIIAIAFPEHFSPQEVWSAVRTVRRGYLAAAAEFVQSDAGTHVRSIVERFVIHNGDKYTVCSMSAGGGEGWLVCFARIRDGAGAIVRGLSTEEAFSEGPHDLTRFGTRVEYPDDSAPAPPHPNQEKVHHA